MVNRRWAFLVSAMVILAACSGPGPSVPGSAAASIVPIPSSVASDGPTTSPVPTASAAAPSPVAAESLAESR